jgi:hypothetical protein
MKNTIKTNIIIAAILLLSQLTFAQMNWKTVKAKNGITIYQRVNDNAKNKSSKITFTVNYTKEEVAAFITNFDNYKNWTSNCTKSKLIKKVDANTWISYSVYSAPFIKDRELYAKTTQQIVNLNTYKIHIEAYPQYAPVNEKFVRLNYFYCDYTITQINKSQTAITVETATDMGGNLSASMVDKFSVNSLLNTFCDFRSQLDSQYIASK